MKILKILLATLMVGCQSNGDQPKNDTSSTQNEIIENAETGPGQVGPEDCSDSEAVKARAELLKILAQSKLENKYRLRCKTKPYVLEGDFDGDHQADIAILVELNTGTAEDRKTGILISTKNNPGKKPFILGAGTEMFGMDDYDWIGIFDTVAKGETLEPNWNEETDDFYLEGDVIPEEKKVKLTSDAIFVHQDEACGGGFIYWKNGRFNWMQNE